MVLELCDRCGRFVERGNHRHERLLGMDVIVEDTPLTQAEGWFLLTAPNGRQAIARMRERHRDSSVPPGAAGRSIGPCPSSR